MNDLNINYASILPEIIAALTGVVIMMVDAFSNKEGARRRGAVIALIGLSATLVAIIGLWTGFWPVLESTTFSGMVVVDELRLFFSMIVVFVGLVASLMATQFLRDEQLPGGEFYSLLMFAITGMLLLTAAGDLVMVFLGLEISSITTYVMACYRRTDPRSNESSLKYFLLGSFSTAFLLYGLALTYGATGTTNIASIYQAISAGSVTYPQLLFIGAAMMLVGFGFKVASAPFHLWTPDVYEGSPTLVTAFMATAAKAAVFAAFLRVFTIGLNATNSPLGAELHAAWTGAISVIAVLTMTIGNVIALSQRNIKRMLAYSSIAHAGYALVGFLTGDYAPVAFYMLTYSVMNLGAFVVVQLFARAGDIRTEIADYAGVGFKVPELSFPLAIFLLSLAGIPPTAGFMGKFFVFKFAWDVAPQLHWLVIAAIINSIISIYYYLYPIVVMFFRPLPERYDKPRMTGALAVALVATLLATFYLGILPNRVLSWVDRGGHGASRAQVSSTNPK
jgi:NADH-quinone oxidoreductase subunit N